ERVLAQAGAPLVEVHVDLGRALLVEDVRRLGRLERDVLDVDLLHAELRAGGLLRRRGAAVGGLFGHPGTAPVSEDGEGAIIAFRVTRGRGRAAGRPAASCR